MSPIIKAALWMAGWLACMVVMAVAGRETTRELDVFQAMLMRSLIGLVLLYPLVTTFAVVVTANHWILDAICGWVALALAWLIVVAVEHRPAPRDRRPVRAPDP